MKIFLVLFLALFSLFDLSAQVRVKGYYKKDGTYVEPHLRTYPDGIIYNNYSYPGNYNPNKDNSYNSIDFSSNKLYSEPSNDYNYERIPTGSLITLQFEAKLKSSSYIFSDVITLVPEHSVVKIESSVERGIYYVSFNGIKGYMNDIYFKKKQ